MLCALNQIIIWCFQYFTVLFYLKFIFFYVWENFFHMLIENIRASKKEWELGFQL